MTAPRRRAPRTRTRVTIYEVAERAGVSVATVSKALNRPDMVAAATRTRVLQMVDELGFTPGAAAGSRTGAGRVGVVAPISAYQSYLARIVGVVAVCGVRQIEVSVFDDDGRAPLGAQLAALAAPGRLDGLMVMGTAPDDETTDLLLRRGLPTVLLDATAPSFTSVMIDDEFGGRLIAAHLESAGARSILCAGPAPPDSTHITSGERRMHGLRAGFDDYGGEHSIEWLVCPDTVEGGRGAADDIARLHPEADAVVAVHDVLAAGIVAGLRGLGIGVPGDVAVVGYDDGDVASALDITTVRQPLEQSGIAAAKALLELLDQPDAPRQHIRILPELVVRSTTTATGDDAITTRTETIA